MAGRMISLGKLKWEMLLCRRILILIYLSITYQLLTHTIPVTSEKVSKKNSKMSYSF